MTANPTPTQASSIDLQAIIEEAVSNGIQLATQAGSRVSLSLPNLLTREEAARYLRISLPTLHRRVKDGSIPRVVLGSKVLFRRSDLDGYVATSQDQSCAKHPEGGCND